MKTWQPGIYRNVSWDEYRSIPYPSQSTMKHGIRSMKRLRRAMSGELAPKPETTAIGNAVHYIVAGEEDRMAVMPAFEQDEANVTKTGKKTTSKSTTYYQDAKKSWIQANQQKTIVTEVDVKVAKKVVGLLWQNQKASELIKSSELELTVIGQIEGVLCKARVDGAIVDQMRGWDLKTTDDIEPRPFYRHAKKLGYYFQFAFQQLLFLSCGPDAFQLQKYEVVAAEVTGDYDNGVLLVPPQLIDDWCEKVERVVADYRIAESSKTWNGLYPSGMGVLDVPDYDMAENGVFQG